MSDQTRIVSVDPAHAERVVADFAASVGLAVPTNAAEVVELLDRLDYDCTPRTLEQFIERGYISDPGDCWDCVAVYCLLGGLESRRRWKPTPSKHDLKKSGARLEIEKLQAEGIDPPVVDLDRTTVEDLLIQLTQCDQRAIREVIFEALKLKLAGYEE